MPRPPDIGYGRDPVREAFRAGRPVKRLLLADGLREEPRLKELRQLAAGRRIIVEPADRRKLDDIAHSEAHQGVGGIVTSHNRSPEVTPAVVKASAGAAEHLRYARVANLAQATETLKNLGFWIVGLSGDAPTLYTEFDYRRPLVLVIGAEGEGLHELMRKKADALVSLPMLGKVTSLNAAVAGSILLYEVLRQRGR